MKKQQMLILLVIICFKGKGVGATNATSEKLDATSRGGWLTLADEVPFPGPNKSSPLSDEGQLIEILWDRCPILRTTYRPVRLYEEAVKVRVLFQTVKLWGLGHSLDSFIVYGFVIAQWDLPECSKWDHAPYWSKIWRIRPTDFAQFSKNGVLPFWYPAIWQTNNKENAFATVDYASSFKFVTSYLERVGLAGYDAPGKYVSFCELSANLSKFPFDTVTCSLQFQSWWPDILVQLSNFGFAVDHTTEGGVPVPDNAISSSMVWKLVSVYTTKQAVTYGMHTYDKVGYSFVLKRKPESYIVNIFIPSVSLFVLLLSAFAMPSSRPDRAGLALAVVMNFFLLQTVVQGQLPDTSETTIMTKYLVSLLWIGVFVMSYFCISFSLSKRKPFRRVVVLNAPLLAGQMQLRTAIDLVAFGVMCSLTVILHIVVVTKMMDE